MTVVVLLVFSNVQRNLSERSSFTFASCNEANAVAALR
uniref:Uncharacterized protein n=1 Tax=Brassica campestris TaxID=3711 RepID=A0A3P5Z614_BRACM|nr:unnamed protein product [Brassica rapa]